MKLYKLATLLLTTALLCSILPLTILPTVKATSTWHVPGDYSTISAAIAAASPGDTIIVGAGTYLETLQITKSLTITANGAVTVRGGAMFSTNYGNRQAVIFVNGATNVMLNGLDVEGNATLGVPGGTKSYGILYQSSTGTINACTVSPNTINDMFSTAIAAWDNSQLTVTGCTVENFGRVGIYSNNATMNIVGNTIIGQPYTDPSYVSYGIEIEDYTGFSVATITHNEIYNCGSSLPSSPGWSSDAIIVDIWRYYNTGSLQPSVVSIEGNNIHDNFEAIEVVANSQIYAHYNNIYGNLYGVWTDTNEHGNYATLALDARFNWWGAASGPNPPGFGDNYDSAHVDATGYLTSSFGARLYTSPNPVLKTNANVGTNFDLDVKIANITDLYGFDVKLTWNNSLITFTACNYASTFDALWGSGNWYLSENTAGAGYYRIIVVAEHPAVGFTGSGTLFTLTFHIVTGSNIATLQTPIHFEIAKLGNSMYTSIPATVEDGLYQITFNKPDLEFQLFNPNPAKPFEYCKTFKVQVYVTNVTSQLTGYNITVVYDTELFRLTGVQWNASVLGTAGSYTESPNGTVKVLKTGGTAYTGASGLLFTLVFHVQFDDRYTHIWRTLGPNTLTRNISFFDAYLIFTEGTLAMSGITMGAALPITVHLIQGDVTCDGKVNVADLQTVAHYYDQSTPTKYDLTMDGIIDVYDLIVVSSNFGYNDP